MVTKTYNMNKGPPRLDLLFTVYLYMTKVLTSQILKVKISVNFMCSIIRYVKGSFPCLFWTLNLLYYDL